MGSPKALLPTPGGLSFVVHIVQTLQAAGVQHVVVVTGRHHDEIAHVLEAAALRVPPRVTRNPDPSRGQLSSLWVAMDAAVTPDTEGLLVTLVDVPLVSRRTIEAVVTRWRQVRAPIVRPAIGERHGHPVIFDRSLFGELRRAPIDAGAKSVVRAYERDLVNVAVDDEGCLVDVDTPEEYRQLDPGS
jgi:molybdenum cofactor cytidylyltransferase